MSDKKEKDKQNVVSYIVIGLFITGAFIIGHLYTKVQILEKNTSVKTKAAENNNRPNTRDNNPKQPSGRAENVPNISNNDHIRGNKNARIALIEYSDFQCPFCRRFHPTAQQALDEYGDKLMWVYRHFPLDQIHPQARPAAEASECVAELGGEDAFWQFADLLFKDQQNNLNDLKSVAKQIGIDTERFSKCLESGKYKQKVENDYQGGIKTGINGTPGTILLDIKTRKTRLVPGAVPFEQLKAALDDMLK